MTKQIGFYRKGMSDIDADTPYLWFADVLKDVAWMGVTESNCLMVQGADTWLESQAKGKDYITLQVSTEGFPEADGFLQRTDSNLLFWNGADYHDSLTGTDLWLCAVSYLVFKGKHPKFIYYKIINNESKENDTREVAAI